MMQRHGQGLMPRSREKALRECHFSPLRNYDHISNHSAKTNGSWKGSPRDQAADSHGKWQQPYITALPSDASKCVPKLVPYIEIHGAFVALQGVVECLACQILTVGVETAAFPMNFQRYISTFCIFELLSY